MGLFFLSSSFTNIPLTIISHSSTDGRVGIGTTAPNSALHIQANTSNKFDAFRISNNTSNDLDFTIQKVNRKHGFNYNSCIIGHGLEIDTTYDNAIKSDKIVEQLKKWNIEFSQQIS